MEVTGEQVAARLGDPALTLLDVRSPAEFSGEGGYGCDPRQGHIPGAVNVDVGEFASRSAVEIRDLLGLPEGAEVIAYCHSGSRSAVAVDALRAAGYRASNYRGSWHEWAADPERPVEGGNAEGLGPGGRPA